MGFFRTSTERAPHAAEDAAGAAKGIDAVASAHRHERPPLRAHAGARPRGAWPGLTELVASKGQICHGQIVSDRQRVSRSLKPTDHLQVGPNNAPCTIRKSPSHAHARQPSFPTHMPRSSPGPPSQPSHARYSAPSSSVLIKVSSPETCGSSQTSAARDSASDQSSTYSIWRTGFPAATKSS